MNTFLLIGNLVVSTVILCVIIVDKLDKYTIDDVPYQPYLDYDDTIPYNEFPNNNK